MEEFFFLPIIDKRNDTILLNLDFSRIMYNFEFSRNFQEVFDCCFYVWRLDYYRFIQF